MYTISASRPGKLPRQMVAGNWVFQRKLSDAFPGHALRRVRGIRVPFCTPVRSVFVVHLCTVEKVCVSIRQPTSDRLQIAIHLVIMTYSSYLNEYVSRGREEHLSTFSTVATPMLWDSM